MNYNFTTQEIVNPLQDVKWFAASPYSVDSLRFVLPNVEEALGKEEHRILVCSKLPTIAFKIELLNWTNVPVKLNDDNKSGKVIINRLTIWFKIEEGIDSKYLIITGAKIM